MARVLLHNRVFSKTGGFMALFIGAFLPDCQLDESTFCKVLTNVAIDLTQFRRHSLQRSKSNVDLYFLMPGKNEKPEHDGIWLRSFDAVSNTLKIEASVPIQMLQSSHAERYVFAVMPDAMDGARDYLRCSRLYFSMMNTYA
jgi:hypothetical protein